MSKVCPTCKEKFFGISKQIHCSKICKLLYGIIKDENGCWLYHKVSASGEYGKMRWDTAWYSAPKLSYQQFVGDVPLGKTVYQTCKVRTCINPDHLYLERYYKKLT